MTNQQASPQGAPSPSSPTSQQVPSGPESTPPGADSQQPPSPSGGDSGDGSSRGQSTPAGEGKHGQAKNKDLKKARKAVDDYLKAVGTAASGAAEQARQRGRAERTLERNTVKIAELDEVIASLEGVAKLEKLGDRRALLDAAEESRRTLATLDELDTLEAEFLLHAKTFGDEKSIPLSAWLEAGVSRKVLKSAGII